MSNHFDPRIPSTSYAGSANSANSPLRAYNSNPVHRVQKSAGVKQMYTSDWANGFSYNSNVQVPSRPGSTAPSITSELSGMSMNSQMSTMSGMSQRSALTINTDLTGFTLFNVAVSQSTEGEKNEINIKTPQKIEWMDQLMKETEALLKNGKGGKAAEKLKQLTIYRDFFELPKPETLNRLFTLIFIEIGRVCALIRKNEKDTAFDDCLRSWLRYICCFYLDGKKGASPHTNNSVTNAIDSVLKEKRCQPLLDFCGLVWPNRKFSLNVVFFISLMFSRKRNYKAAIRNRTNYRALFGNLLVMAKDDFTNSTTRATAIKISRQLISNKNTYEEELIQTGVIPYCLNLLSNELEEPVIYNILLLLSQILQDKKHTGTVCRKDARQQFFQIEGVELLTTKFLTHGSPRVINEALKVLINVSTKEMPKELVRVVLPAVFMLYGANDVHQTAYSSQIICQLAHFHKPDILEFGGVTKVLHMLHQVMGYNGIEQQQWILDISINCFWTLKVISDLDGEKPVKPFVAKKIYEWRSLGNEDFNGFAAGFIFLSYLAHKVQLRKEILRIFKSMSMDQQFRHQILSVFVQIENCRMDIMQLLVEIIWKNYKDYDTVADKKSSNKVIEDCCILLIQLIMKGNDSEKAEYRQRIMYPLKMDIRKNGQRREPLRLVEDLQEDRDIPVLTLIKLLVESCPDSIPIFQTERQLLIVNTLVLHSNPNIQKIGRILLDCLHPHGMNPFPHEFHSLTPQLTPNHELSSTAMSSSLASLVSPNPNLDGTQSSYIGYHN